MRRKPVRSEAKFKRRLIAAGIPFKCQVIIGFYIADFVFPEKMLIIELDGDSHKGAEEYDRRRDAFLRSVGFDILRMKNEHADAFDVRLILQYQGYPLERFRSALAKANSLKGKAGRKKYAKYSVKRVKFFGGDLPVPTNIVDRGYHNSYLDSLSCG